MRSPFLGPAYVAESTFLADQRCINLYAELVDTKTGKDIGAFFMAPGLDLETVCGGGPIRGAATLGNTMYVASGNQVYAVDTSWNLTFLGNIGTSTGAVSFITNSYQVVLFDGFNGYLLPDGAPLVSGTISQGGVGTMVGDVITLAAVGGTQIGTAQVTITGVGSGLSGATLLSGGTGGYGVGDTITLAPGGGTQVAPATVRVASVGVSLANGAIGTPGTGYSNGDIIVLLSNDAPQAQVAAPSLTVTGVGGGGDVTSFTVSNPGSFSALSSSFSQSLTTGGGTGFTLISPTYNGGAVTAFSVIDAGDFTVPPTTFSQASTSGGGAGFFLGNPAFGTFTAASFSVTLGGSFIGSPTSFIQVDTTGSGSGFVITSPIFGSAGIYTLTLPFSNPTMGTYQDGFGLVIPAGSQQVYQSAVGDLSLWPALNFSAADAQGEPLAAINTLNDQPWFVSKVHTEVWGDAGLNGFAFQRIAGAVIEHGCAAPASLAKVGDSLMCLSRDINGQGVIVQSSGYSWVRVSTHALEYAISQYSAIEDAVAFSYQQSGHLFYFISFPTANVTWVYDATASAQAKIPMWTQRAAWDGVNFNRHWANCFVPFNNKLVVGDYRNGNIYSFNLLTETDAGTARRWLRSWRAMAKPSQEPVRFSPLVIDMQTGIGVQTANPKITLRWSDDGGNNWSNPVLEPVGNAGQTALRVMFTRIGSTRRNSGLDRILELSSVDAFAVALIGAVFLDERV